LEKSKVVNSDILCFDLEDSVPISEKVVARRYIENIIEEFNDSNNDIKKERIIAVRTNAPTSHQISEDLEKIVIQGLDAIVIPKVDDEAQIKKISQIIGKKESERNIPKGHVKILPSVESSLGVVNAFSIAKSDARITALVFGIFDFLHDMKIDNYDNDLLSSYIYGRAKVPVDARAAGVESIDSIWQDINDVDGLIRDLKLGKKFGYSGKCIIHPSQIEKVHETFSPTPQDIDWANKVIQSLENAQNSKSTGAIKLEGKMIDAVHYKQAKRILGTE
jgi:citrate lyase subunit beta/citryl-CoA lyase